MVVSSVAVSRYLRPSPTKAALFAGLTKMASPNLAVFEERAQKAEALVEVLKARVAQVRGMSGKWLPRCWHKTNYGASVPLRAALPSLIAVRWSGLPCSSAAS